MNYLNITYPDVNNGSGCRVTLWVAGCPHHCKGCHNPESWNFKAGKEFGDNALRSIKNALANTYIDGLTISGGDPLSPENIEEVFALCLKLYKSGLGSKNIWVYTGYNFEYLISEYRDYLTFIDVIVDGPFVEELKDVSLPFRGSSNQRIIDVQKSLEQNEIVLWNF